MTSIAAAGSTRYEYRIPFVIGASAIGTVIEWYDFYLYAVLATFLAPVFFPGDPTAQVLSALATFGAGFAVRPFGAVVFGRIGDKTGRKVAFLLTVSIMGGATVLVGLLPGYAQIGVLAPIILVTLRMLQGLALGGEYGGAAIYVAEHAPEKKRGQYTSWIQTTATIGLFLALAVILVFRLSMGDEAFADFGWRIPFLLGAVLVFAALYIRLKLQETPLYRRAKAQGLTSDAPLQESLGTMRNWRLILLALFGMTAGQAVVWYTGQFYALSYMTGSLGVKFTDAYTVMLIGIALATPFFIFFGWLSDRIGRKPIILGGCLIAAITYFPIFNAMKGFANPVQSGTDTAGKAVFTAQDPNIAGLTAMVFVMIVFVTMVYGPIAAFLVEYFPARIRYTSLSVPYHLGNGEFGGWLPFIATAVTAAAVGGGALAWLGSITPGGAGFAGLWYPIIIALMSVVIGAIWVKETKDERIWDEVGGHDEAHAERREAPPDSALAG
jgi:MFS family permease